MKNELDKFCETNDDCEENWGLTTTIAAESVYEICKGSEGCPIVVKVEGKYLSVKRVDFEHSSDGSYAIVLETGQFSPEQKE